MVPKPNFLCLYVLSKMWCKTWPIAYYTNFVITYTSTMLYKTWRRLNNSWNQGYLLRSCCTSNHILGFLQNMTFSLTLLKLPSQLFLQSCHFDTLIFFVFNIRWVIEGVGPNDTLDQLNPFDANGLRTYCNQMVDYIRFHVCFLNIICSLNQHIYHMVWFC